MDTSKKKNLHSLSNSNGEKALGHIEDSCDELVETLKSLGCSGMDIWEATLQLLLTALSSTKKLTRKTPLNNQLPDARANTKSALWHAWDGIIHFKDAMIDLFQSGIYTGKAISDKYNEEWGKWKYPKADFTSDIEERYTSPSSLAA